METANDFAAQLHRASLVSPFFFVLGDNTKSGAPIAINASKTSSFSFTTPSGKTLRLLRLQYVAYTLENDKYILGPRSNRVLRRTAKRYLNVKIIHDRSTPLMEDNPQSNLQSNTKATINNGAIVSTELQPGHLRLSRLVKPLSQITIEITNNYSGTVYFNGLLVALGVDA